MRNKFLVRARGIDVEVEPAHVAEILDRLVERRVGEIDRHLQAVQLADHVPLARIDLVLRARHRDHHDGRGHHRHQLLHRTLLQSPESSMPRRGAR